MGAAGVQGLAGPAGPAGPQGPAGSQGVAGESYGWTFVAANGANFYGNGAWEATADDETDVIALIPLATGGLAGAITRQQFPCTGQPVPSASACYEFAVSVNAGTWTKHYVDADCSGDAWILPGAALPGASRYAVTRNSTDGPVLMVATGPMVLGSLRPMWTSAMAAASRVTESRSGFMKVESEIVLNQAFPAPITSIGF